MKTIKWSEWHSTIRNYYLNKRETVKYLSTSKDGNYIFVGIIGSALKDQWLFRDNIWRRVDNKTGLLIENKL